MEVEWRRLRADELRALARPETIVIVPVASIEQHGPHLPVEVDTTLGEEVALRTARRIGDRGGAAIVLPVLWTGLSEHHMSFGGTITLDVPAFAALLEGVCRSVTRHGFRRIVLSNSHGGNENALRTITDELTIKLGVPIIQFTYPNAAAPAIAALLTMQTGVQHACEAETAMMMAVRPELVANERIALARSNPPPNPEPGFYRWRAIGARSASGALGHPEAATAAQGEQLLDAIADVLAAKLANEETWTMPWQAEPAE
jgi:creatinine amidohydrolase